MKRKQGFYSTEPVVPAKKIAGENPVGGVTLGTMNPRMVPEATGASHAFGPHEREFGTPHVKGAHGWGHPPHARKGHERLSGDPLAHRIGKK